MKVTIQGGYKKGQGQLTPAAVNYIERSQLMTL